MAHRVTLIPGDGTGPELTEATRRVLEATGVEFDWDVQHAGADVMEANGGNPLPEETLDSIRENGVALKGPITTPVGGGFRSVNVGLRKELDLYAQVRPCKTYPGVRTRFDDVDLVIVRENTEDLYAGIEFEQGTPDAEELIRWIESKGGRLRWRDAGISIKPISVTGTRRIFEFAFDYARRNGRRKITAVHKANIMKFSDGLWLRVAREVAAENPDIEFDDRIVDNMCMQLVQRPEEYDVLVLPNLYGDVLSDLCAGMIGGLGVAPGANFGEHAAGLRADPRLGAEVHGPEQGQPDGADALGDADAAPPRRDRGGRPAGDGDRRGDPRGQERHVRHEADPRRPDRRRDERGRRRDHRQAGSSRRVRRKVTVVGAGNVGATCAQELARRDYADVVLVDIIPNFPQGKALDMNQAGAVLGFEPNILGTNGYEETEGSDVVVITAGKPRSPGMSRDDLVTTNEAIVGSVTREVVKRSRDAIIVVVSNPLDAMCHVAKAVSRLHEGARLRHGRHPRHGPLLRLHRLGDRLLGQGRDRDGARRPRRPDGAGRLRDDRRRRAARPARPGGRDQRRWSSARARAAARSSTCSAPPPGTRRARRRRRWSTRSCSTRSACSRARRTSRASTASTASTWACR